MPLPCASSPRRRRRMRTCLPSHRSHPRASPSSRGHRPGSMSGHPPGPSRRCGRDRRRRCSCSSPWSLAGLAAVQPHVPDVGRRDATGTAAHAQAVAVVGIGRRHTAYGSGYEAVLVVPGEGAVTPCCLVPAHILRCDHTTSGRSLLGSCKANRLAWRPPPIGTLRESFFGGTLWDVCEFGFAIKAGQHDLVAGARF